MNAKMENDAIEKEYCFEVVYPYTLLMPDGTLITLESKDDGEKLSRPGMKIILR